MVIPDVFVVNLFGLGPKRKLSEDSQCLHESFPPDSFGPEVRGNPVSLPSVLTGPVEELAEDMLGVDGRPERLGLGKPRAFLAVGCLGRWTTS